MANKKKSVGKKLSGKKKLGTNKKLPSRTKKTKRTKYIGLVLDQSSSMHMIEEQAVSGFNDTLGPIREDYEAGNKVRVWSVLFSDDVTVLDAGVSPDTIQPLTQATYEPSGCTALYDAIAKTILSMEAAAAKDKNAVFLLTVLTDGMENASKDYGGASGFGRLKALIARVQKTGNWTINYIGCDGIEQLAVATGVSLGNTMTYTPNSAGMKLASDTRTFATRSYLSATNAGATSTLDFIGNVTASGKLVAPASAPVSRAKRSRKVKTS